MSRQSTFVLFLPLSFALAVAVLPVAQAAAQTTPPTAATAVTLKPVDTDGDGKATRIEWGKFAQTFTALDADRDQAVDLAELQKGTGDATETPGVLTFADTDGNGKLTRPEWTAIARGFARVDVNRDGHVTQPELQTAADATTAALKPGGALSNVPSLWRGRIVEGRGENPNRGEEIELAITGNRIAGRNVRPQSDGTPNLGIGTFVMTGNGQSGFLDAQYTDGPHSGQTCLGIFRIEGDTLQWCASNRSGYRPPEFATGSGCWLMILKKIDEPKKN